MHTSTYAIRVLRSWSRTSLAPGAFRTLCGCFMDALCDLWTGSTRD